MEKGYESILKLLKAEEEIIYKTDRNFKFGEKSTLIIGEKVLCISNLGRIFVADRNRRLTGVKVIEYNYKIKGVKCKVLNKENIIALNSRDFTDNKTETFILNMKIDDFINMYKKLKENPFIIEWSKYIAKIDDNPYESAVLEFRHSELSINTLSSKVNVQYDEIVDCKALDGFVHIITNNSRYYNILIHCFNKSTNEIKYKIDTVKNKEVEKQNIESEIEYTQIMNYSDYLEVKGVEEVVNDIAIEEKIKNDDSTLKDYCKEHVQCDENEEEKFEVKEISTEIAYDKRILANLYGKLNSINYKGKEVEVILDEDIKLINNELNKEILNQKFEKYEYMKDKEILILQGEGNLFLLNFKKGYEVNSKYEDCLIENTFLGYTMEYQPFIANFTDRSIVFEQGNGNILNEITKDYIADIDILDNRYLFESVAITSVESEIFKLYIRRDEIKDFISKTYLLKANEYYSSLSYDELENIYFNCKKEYLKLFFFSNIRSMKLLIDDFYKGENKDKGELISKLFSKLEFIEKELEILEMYYIDGFEISKGINSLIIKQEFRHLCNKLLSDIKNIKKELKTMNVFKKELAISYRSVDFISDVDLEITTYNKDYILIKDIFINEEINDIKFDFKILNIVEIINKILYLDMKFYLNSIDEILDCVNVNYEKADYMIDSIVEYFANMQFKSKENSKYSLKEISGELDKFAQKLSKDEANILNLANF